MSERDALLAAINANPDEDTPRLVYADWLQENGNETRAQFIRLQVDAARAEPFSPEAQKLANAARELLEQHSFAWAAHVAERALGWRFERGFVEHVDVNAATFVRDAAALFAAEPIRSLRVERFVYTTTPAPLDPIFNVPQMARVTRLDFTQLGQQRQHRDYFDSFALACPRFTGLTDLNLWDNPVSVDWLRTILTGPQLPALEGLNLGENAHLGPVLADALPNASHRRFARLDLSYIPFKAELIQKVLTSRCLRELEELRFAWRGSSGAGPLTRVTLGWTISWDRLRLLDLNGQRIGDAGVADIVNGLGRRPGFAPLRWLGLANNGLNADGVRALVDSDRARLKLYYLDARGNSLSAGHRAALKARFPEAVIEG